MDASFKFYLFYLFLVSVAELLAENALILERMRVRTDPRQIKLKYFFGKHKYIFVCYAMCLMMVRESEEV